MRMVPPQLQRRGMTGNVPYYGGRLTPGQIYAVSHQPPPPAVVPPPLAKDDRARLALQQLLDAGILTPEEHAEYRRRVDG
ncbi:MAG TPA: hypothetical protein VFV00_02055 [Acidimicrobiales bacterium]|nr:hypothetical protein [Acidimicrobiales bacterium]